MAKRDFEFEELLLDWDLEEAIDSIDSANLDKLVEFYEDLMLEAYIKISKKEREELREVIRRELQERHYLDN